MAFLDDLATALDSASVTGGATGWATTKAFMPDSPDKVVHLTESGGNPSEQGETGYDFPSFQAVVRSTQFDYEGARSKADAVVSALNNTQTGSTVYVYTRHAPLPIGYDQNNRPMISLNFDCMKVRA